MLDAVYLNLDGAWGDCPLKLPVLEARAWGGRLRYITSQKTITQFNDQIVAKLPPVVLYGSGDFHHLAALFAAKACEKVQEPVTVISFDNHPDWDIRPPRWGCGGWVNRALEIANVRGVEVWGCGNFELQNPARWFGNRRALASGQLRVHGWRERFENRAIEPCEKIRHANEEWKQNFAQMARNVSKNFSGALFYVTVDLDCLNESQAVTHWENGLFTAADVAWAIGELRRHGCVIGADVCGAALDSRAEYATWWQRLAGWWDHPRLAHPKLEQALAINLRSLATIWPVIVNGE